MGTLAGRTGHPEIDGVRGKYGGHPDRGGLTSPECAAETTVVKQVVDHMREGTPK